MAEWVADGVRTLKDTRGTGERVTVLNEDTVMPRNVLSIGRAGGCGFEPSLASGAVAAAVMTATGCGILRMSWRMWDERSVGSLSLFLLVCSRRKPEAARAGLGIGRHLSAFVAVDNGVCLFLQPRNDAGPDALV